MKSNTLLDSIYCNLRPTKICCNVCVFYQIPSKKNNYIAIVMWNARCLFFSVTKRKGQ